MPSPNWNYSGGGGFKEVGGSTGKGRCSRNTLSPVMGGWGGGTAGGLKSLALRKRQIQKLSKYSTKVLVEGGHLKVGGS